MAYGARLESVLGESPRGFESPILRQTRNVPTPRGSMDTTRLRPHTYLLRRGVATALAFFVPAFGVLYFLTIPDGPWAVVLATQVVVALALGYSVFAYARLGIWVKPDSITERGLAGLKKTIPATAIDSILMVDTFRGGWIETVPQLFVCGPGGKQLMRMRGQFWSRDAMTTVASTLTVKVTELPDPVSTAELHASHPGLLYWFERRPVLAAGAFTGVLVVGAGLLYVILALLGETVAGER